MVWNEGGLGFDLDGISRMSFSPEFILFVGPRISLMLATRQTGYMWGRYGT